MRYFLYCRKSTEAEDRQILSIDSQEAELRQAFAAHADIEIIETLRESYSAKAPGRPIFNAMMDRIERGEADGILAWHPDRLARNSVDGGRIIYLLDREILKDLKFATFSFENSPQGKLMLQVLLGFSKYYVDALSENVKRGNRAKIKQGWRPNLAPMGYLNDRNTRTIMRDPERFPLIRKMFDLALSENYSLREIRDATIQWELRTPLRRRIGGNYLSIAAVHRTLINPFYAGILRWNNQDLPGAHEPMITIEEHDQVRRALSRKGKPTPQKRTFPFTGLIRCGECGFMVTAEMKSKPNGRSYLYYHCSKRRLDYMCKQPSVTGDELQRMLLAMLRNTALPSRMYDFFFEALAQKQIEARGEHDAQSRALQRAVDETTQATTSLTHLKIRSLISDEEFVRERQGLQRELLRLKEAQKIASNPGTWFEPTQMLVSFGSEAAKWFEVTDDRTKRLILKSVGSNYTLTDKKLSVEARKPFVWVSKSDTCLRWRGAVEDVGSIEKMPSRQQMSRMLKRLREMSVSRDPEFLETIALVRKVMEMQASYQFSSFNGRPQDI